MAEQIGAGPMVLEVSMAFGLQSGHPNASRVAVVGDFNGWGMDGVIRCGLRQSAGAGTVPAPSHARRAIQV